MTTQQLAASVPGAKVEAVTVVSARPVPVLFGPDGKLQDRIIDSIERRIIVPLSDQRVWELEREGRFPKRIKLGTGKFGKVGWYLSEVLTYLEAKKSARDAEMAEAS